MSRTIEKTIKLYSFSELSAEAQKTAIEKNQDINTDYYWSEPTIWDWKDKLEALGFENPEINFSGFWSQGDGASFTAESINLEKLIKAKRSAKYFNLIRKYIKSGELTANVYRSSSHYYHENTVTADYVDYPATTTVKQDNQIRALLGMIENLVIELSQEIYKDLQNEYEYRTSEDSIKDSLIANEYEFLESGLMFNE